MGLGGGARGDAGVRRTGTLAVLSGPMPDIVSPIDHSVAHTYEELNTEQALAGLDAAHQAQRSWAPTRIEDRVSLCRGMLSAYRGRLAQNAEQITRMMGKPLGQARGEFEGGVCERTELLCSIAEQALRDDVLPPRPGLRRIVRHEPVGVVLDIAAWNYPLLVPLNVIVPAVLAGNAVLIKHAPQTAGVAEQFQRAFAEAGAPPGLVQAFMASHDTVAEVIRSRRLGYVAFTGSVRGGREVLRTVAQDNFIASGFELGGKDPALVLPDADLQFTVDSLVDGAYYNAGQSCCGIERIYVHADVHAAFVEAYAQKVRAYKLGNPLDEGVDLGPVVNAAAATRVREHNAGAQAAGARPLIDADAFEVPDTSPCYVAPQAFDGVDHSMALMREETFGPTVGIMKVASAEEGVALMNDSRYGLTASLWSTDLDRAEALARQVEAGTVFVNRCDYLDPAMPWTGVKDSGVGCSLSEYGFQQVTRLKSYHFRTEIPK